MPGFALDCDGAGTCCRFYPSIAFSTLDAARARAAEPRILDGGADPDRIFLPLYGVLQVVIGVMHFGGMGFRIYPGAPWARHILSAMICFGLSGVLRLAEFFIAQGTGGVS